MSVPSNLLKFLKYDHNKQNWYYVIDASFFFIEKTNYFTLMCWLIRTIKDGVNRLIAIIKSNHFHNDFQCHLSEMINSSFDHVFGKPFYIQQRLKQLKPH